MDISKESKQLLGQIIFRASSGLHFLEDELRHRSGSTDAAYSRSRYLLMSYNTDLLLNALLLLSYKSDREEAIFTKMFKVGSTHNFEKMFNHVTEEVVKFAVIKSIIRKVRKIGSNQFVEYEINTVAGERVVVQDFVEIRYDFKKKHGIGEGRPSNANEITEMKLEVKIIIKIIQKLETLLD